MFNLLEYLEDLKRYGKVVERFTWIEATCPICGGRLKISKNPHKFGAYACYTNSCHLKDPNPIRNLLYKKDSFHQKSSFAYTPCHFRTLDQLVTPKSVITAKPTDFLTTQPFIKPHQNRIVDPETQLIKTYTYFDYEDFRQVRIDFNKTKALFTESFDPGTNSYVLGLPAIFTGIPVYQRRYLQANLLFVEGEKVATIAHKLGLAAITFPNFLTTERYLDRLVQKLAEFGVENIIYLADNDTVGKQKGELFCHLFWKYKISARQINLVDYYPEFQSIIGFDLYDLYRLKNLKADSIENLLEVLCAAND